MGDSRTYRPGESSTAVRVEMVGERLVELIVKLDLMDQRQREDTLAQREQLVELRSSVNHMRDLLDRAGRDTITVRADLVDMEKRVEKLEHGATRTEGQGALAVGGGVAGGGLIAAVIELVQRWIGS